MTCLRRPESYQGPEGDRADAAAVSLCSPPSPTLHSFFHQLTAEDDDFDLASLLDPDALLAEVMGAPALAALDAVPAWISTDSWPGHVEPKRSRSMSPGPCAAGSGTGIKADPFRALSTQLSTHSSITAADCCLPEELPGPKPFSAGSLQRLAVLSSSPSVPQTVTATAPAQGAAGSQAGPFATSAFLPRQESLASASSILSRTSTLRLPALLPPAMVGQASTDSEGLTLPCSVLQLPVLAPELMPSGWGPPGAAVVAAGGDGDEPAMRGLRRVAGLEGSARTVPSAAKCWPAGVAGPGAPGLSPSAEAASPSVAQPPMLPGKGKAPAEASPEAAGTPPAAKSAAAPPSAPTAGAEVKRTAARPTKRRKAAPAAAAGAAAAASPAPVAAPTGPNRCKAAAAAASAPAGASAGHSRRTAQAQQRGARSTKRRSDARKEEKEDRELAEMQEHVRLLRERNTGLALHVSELTSVTSEVKRKLAGLYADAMAVETANARLRGDNAAMWDMLAPCMPLLQHHHLLVHQVMDVAAGRAAPY